MGTKEKVAQYVGKKGFIKTGGMEVRVNILDYKMSYGRERFQVTPIEGSGEVWVESVNVLEQY